MSVNRHKPHLIVLCEDNAYKYMLVGFTQCHNINQQIDISKPVLCGWSNVQKEITTDNSLTIKTLQKFDNALVLAVIDSDQDIDRIADIKENINEQYRERIFIISALNEAEDVRKEIIGQGKMETLGLLLAEDCQEGSCKHWQSQQLQHNQQEINRLTDKFDLFH